MLFSNALSYRPILEEFGVWDQLRVDHGREWYPMLYVQEQLSHLRTDHSRAPHLQTTSKLNHCVEREVNTRVNYPIKSCLIYLEEQHDFNLDLDHKFGVSWFTIRVSNIGTKMAIQSWNNHCTPGLSILYWHACG